MADVPSTPGKLGPFPLWVWIVGAGAVALLAYRARQSKTATENLGAPPLVGGVATDPNTGFPIDPLSGLPYPTSQPAQQNMTLGDWVLKAESALAGSGVSPALASSALYNYQAGNPLTAQESGAVNKALGLVGFPPVTLPFLGPIPGTTQGSGPDTGHQKPEPIPTGTGNPAAHKPTVLAPIAALSAAVKSKLLPGEHIVGSVRASQYGPAAGYYYSNLGGVFAVGGAPFRGSYLGLPKSARQGTRSFTGLKLLPGGGYELVSNRGETYAFRKAA